ncbi:methylated-DNA--[protein]-cysteine S-methyltransferase [Corynebacterium anserum]|uniref:methylated-DNA--[protein]-cysteine S-methyltransferase n=1 Tax=Corynebacterium anserum TaxID=2684406 RepID=A0A7G7YN41_9CORY|nr:methylated-DNA--[protein]-cysteine S-methyltransferase [Corynebacterium anserum]MBC2680852.1 methylated-DNA--[protein]-cysteine S-methyltransferase [Corynebacterium anserum]QNH95911.1 methylated-DNA--[protein]-cysteine S-methyltransferase [Corynebacterium anserum]
MNNTHFAVVKTPCGDVLLRISDEALIGLWFRGMPHTPQVDPSLLIDATTHPLVRSVDIQLDEYFRGVRKHFDVPLSLRGSDWHKAVWQRLRDIPWGATTSYGEIARDIGSPRAYRAVGTAVRMNPVSIIVPCHRVLPASGKLGNYAGGAENKRMLLRLEGIEL